VVIKSPATCLVQVSPVRSSLMHLEYLDCHLCQCRCMEFSEQRENEILEPSKRPIMKYNYTTTKQRYSNTNLCYYRLEKVLLALLVTYLFLCSNWPCYYRLVYCNTSTCLQEHLSSVTIVFVVTLFFALVTLDIMVECIVCDTFIYVSKHFSSVTRIICCNTFLVLVTLLHYGGA